MKAILVNRDKSLRYDNVPDPVINKDEVLVKIVATAEMVLIEAVGRGRQLRNVNSLAHSFSPFAE